MEHPAGRKLKETDVKLEGAFCVLDQAVKPPNELSPSEGSATKLAAKQKHENQCSNTKPPAKTLAMHGLLSVVSLLHGRQVPGTCRITVASIGWAVDFD